MFFQGTLQEGIAAALSQSKLVLCFVTDNQAESKVWESQYLQDDSLAPLLRQKTVALRLEAGSQEAGYLAAIFPLPKTPTIVIIRNGELKEYITAGTSEEDFFRRVTAALSGETGQASASAPPAGPAHGQASVEPSARPAEPTVTATDDSSGQATPSSSAEDQQGESGTGGSQDRVVAQALAERAARLTAQRKAAAEEAARQRKIAKGKAKATADGGEGEGKGDEKDQAGLTVSESKKHAEMLRRRKLEDAEARKRIQRMIDDDKAARRAAQADRAAQREMEKRAALGLEDEGGSAAADAASATGPTSPVAPAAASSRAPISRSSAPTELCALQVRLMDGSSLRNRFPSGGSLGKDVRRWIDENRQDGGRDAYTFKQILTPLPNRTLDVTEEDKSLAALGLCPSSTLVLIPVQGSSSAYAAGTGGVASRLFAPVIAFFNWFFGLLFMFLRKFLGGNGATDAVPAQQFDTPRPGPARNREHPSEKRNDYQLYNGNSLNFEPRKDDEDEG